MFNAVMNFGLGADIEALGEDVEVLTAADLDLPEVVRSVRSLLASALGPACPLELRLPEESLMVHSDRSEIEQIVLNLAVNARAAMPRGGPFTIEVEGRGDEVILRASDRGVGIAESVRGRIFDPFFTTRRDSGGSGMGLAVVQAAMLRAGGRVEVDSVEGQGATFTLRCDSARVNALSDAGSETTIDRNMTWRSSPWKSGGVPTRMRRARHV